jgi:hypothetical protein
MGITVVNHKREVIFTMSVEIPLGAQLMKKKYCNYDVIQNQLLMTLNDDGGKVAIVLNQADLEFVISALPACDLKRGMIDLRNQCFGEDKGPFHFKKYQSNLRSTDNG